jgi:membrane-bound lytic murein transglycosylase B
LLALRAKGKLAADRIPEEDSMQRIDRLRAAQAARAETLELRRAAACAASSVTLCALAVLAISHPPAAVDPVAHREVRTVTSTPPKANVPVWPVEQPAEITPLAMPSAESADMSAVAGELTVSGVPRVALEAYLRAAAVLHEERPGCGLDWALVAAIGRVESNHGRFGGAVLTVNGTSTPPVVGPRLDGGPFATVRDSDGGRLDGDTEFDRAVGPMQFLPSTWAAVQADGNGDGVRDPHNIFDAAIGAGSYLCSGGADLTVEGGLRAAVFRYNRSDAYVNLVLSLANDYRNNSVTVAEGTQLALTAPPGPRTAAPAVPPTVPVTTPAGGPASGAEPVPSTGVPASASTSSPAAPATTTNPASTTNPATTTTSTPPLIELELGLGLGIRLN